MQVNLSNPIVARTRLTLARPKPHFVSLPNKPTTPSRHLSFARRPNSTDLSISSSPKTKTDKLRKIEDVDDAEDIDDDELEALFSQLEEDLKRDDGDDEEMTEEDLQKLKEELAEVDELIAEVFDMTGFEDEDSFDNESLDETDSEDEEDEEEQKPLHFKNWQLRRLAVALKNGRRKTNIKSLAAEICIDRRIVLELLRNPPPSLIMLSASLPDEEPSPVITVAAETEVVVEPIPKTNPKPAAAPKVPVHVMQERFSSQKRIKKVHIQTLEDVYRRSKRPTNAMIKSIVEVTNLPRKKVVKWFEDKRQEEGIPEQRTAYQRSEADSAH